MNMFTKNSKAPRSTSATPPRKRGRPPGPTAQGEETRERLYDAAIALIAERGFEAATLRDVAARAGVSAGLLYRYFPSKRAVVLALYDDLSAQCVARAGAMPAGSWRDRFAFALDLSLQVLRPHRQALTSLIPVLVGTGDEGLFSPAVAFSRERVQELFRGAVEGARDAPRGEVAAALGRLLYLAHLAVLLWWLLDRSASQRATTGLVRLIRRALPALTWGLKLKAVRDVILEGNELFAAEIGERV
jgi:AcrR family transcriptional regulator